MILRIPISGGWRDAANAGLALLPERGEDELAYDGPPDGRILAGAQPGWTGGAEPEVGVFVAVVQYGMDAGDLGVVVRFDDGLLTVLWPDEHEDVVFEVAGEPWADMGDDEVPFEHRVPGLPERGTPLPVVSRNPADAPDFPRSTLRPPWRLS